MKLPIVNEVETGLSVMAVIGFVVFFLVITIFIWVISRVVRQWLHNEQQQKVEVDVKIVAKRTRTHGFEGARTDYYVTVQYEAGEREEFYIDGERYGLLAEGDQGTLTRQGTRFLAFKRTLA